MRRGKVTATRMVKGAARLNDLTCASPRFCVVVGAKVNTTTGDPSGAVVLTLRKGKRGPVKVVNGVNDLSAVGCKTAAGCYAFGVFDKNVVVPIIRGKPGKPINITPHISGVACRKTSCVAVGTVGSFHTQGVVYIVS